jgi:hypothetical protein
MLKRTLIPRAAGVFVRTVLRVNMASLLYAFAPMAPGPGSPVADGWPTCRVVSNMFRSQPREKLLVSE